MHFLFNSVLLRVLLVVLALAWVLGWLPVNPGYVQVQLLGWSLETSVANLTFILLVALLAIQLLLWLLGLPIRLFGGLRSRNQSQRNLALIGAALEEDWQRVRKDLKALSPKTPEWRLLNALALLHSGSGAAALVEFKYLEKIPALRDAARLNRTRALRQEQGQEAALELMDKTRRTQEGAGWRDLRLELLGDLGRWAEVNKLLRKETAQTPALPLHERLRQHSMEYLLLHTEDANQLLERWQNLQGPDKDKDKDKGKNRDRDKAQAARLLPATVQRLLELHHPDMAADLLATQIQQSQAEAAIAACFLLPPGAHCRAPLQALQEARERLGSNRQMRAASAWLLLCSGNAAEAADLLADWGLDRA